MLHLTDLGRFLVHCLEAIQKLNGVEKNTNTSVSINYKALSSSRSIKTRRYNKHKKGTFFKYENVQRTSETLGRQPENELSGVKSLLITIKKAFIKCKLEKALRKLKFHSAPCGTI